VGLFDTLLGRSKQAAPNLDALFALPAAVPDLATNLALHPSGVAAVCWKQGSGGASLSGDQEIQDLLRVDATSAVDFHTDDLGFEWAVFRASDLPTLVTNAHGVHSTLVDRGLGPRLLCSVFRFDPDRGGDPTYLVYLAKSGSFYPFAPLSGQMRNNELELQIRTFLGNDLPVEKDLTKWMALWGLPL
jgi:hypothetical protein